MERETAGRWVGDMRGRTRMQGYRPMRDVQPMVARLGSWWSITTTILFTSTTASLGTSKVGTLAVGTLLAYNELLTFSIRARSSEIPATLSRPPGQTTVPYGK